jgi:hypothetical protein
MIRLALLPSSAHLLRRVEDVILRYMNLSEHDRGG